MIAEKQKKELYKILFFKQSGQQHSQDVDGHALAAYSHNAQHLRGEDEDQALIPTGCV